MILSSSLLVSFSSSSLSPGEIAAQLAEQIALNWVLSLPYTGLALAPQLENFMHSYFSPSSLTPPFSFQLKWRSLHRYLLPIKWILHYQPHSPDLLYPPFISPIPLRFPGSLPGTYGKNSKSCTLYPLKIILEFKQAAPWAQHEKC